MNNSGLNISGRLMPRVLDGVHTKIIYRGFQTHVQIGPALIRASGGHHPVPAFITSVALKRFHDLTDDDLYRSSCESINSLLWELRSEDVDFSPTSYITVIEFSLREPSGFRDVRFDNSARKALIECIIDVASRDHQEYKLKSAQRHNLTYEFSDQELIKEYHDLMFNGGFCEADKQGACLYCADLRVDQAGA